MRKVKEKMATTSKTKVSKRWSQFQKNKSSVVYITEAALAKMQAYIEHAPGEISGLGEVELYRQKDFLITDVFIFKQDTSGGHTELAMDDVFNFLAEAMDEGRDLGKIHLWWHSHPDFGTFWSETDETTADVFTNAGWMICIVGNRAGKYLTRVDFYGPRMTADRFTLMALREKGIEVTIDIEAIKAEIEEKVTYRPPAPILPPLDQELPSHQLEVQDGVVYED